LIESLEEQIALQNLDERKQKIAQYIIGNLDENGYLQRESEINFRIDLLFHEHIDVSSLEMEDVLYEIQDLDPPGVGARDLQECLFVATSAQAAYTFYQTGHANSYRVLRGVFTQAL